MMNWTELTLDWAASFPRVKDRFPHLDDTALSFVKHDRTRFEAYLADTHQLTLTEAREEFADFLFVEALNRELDS